jgi:hypothetical protein
MIYTNESLGVAMGEAAWRDCIFCSHRGEAAHENGMRPWLHISAISKRRDRLTSNAHDSSPYFRTFWVVEAKEI